MKTKTAFGLLAVATLALSSVALAGSATDYQVTGPVLELNNNMIVVQKGAARWEIARDSSSKVPSDLKVGDKVTIHYTMTATTVEIKPAKAAKTGAQKKEGASAAASPKP
jgi:hypothetical protein